MKVEHKNRDQESTAVNMEHSSLENVHDMGLILDIIYRKLLNHHQSLADSSESTYRNSHDSIAQSRVDSSKLIEKTLLKKFRAVRIVMEKIGERFMVNQKVGVW